MKRYIKIYKCRYYPNRYYWPINNPICRILERNLPTEDEIPAWCPKLPENNKE